MTSNTDLNRPYRPCVGIMMVNQDNQIFVAQRLDHPAEFWQMPQGGVEEGEKPVDAVKRELLEEIGTNNVDIIARAKRDYKYDIPAPLNGRLWQGKYRGQKQTWYLARFKGEDSDINLETHDPEFIAWRWAPLEELLGLVVHFKREVYKSVIDEFRQLLT